jgi:hypothetical protein
MSFHRAEPFCAGAGNRSHRSLSWLLLMAATAFGAVPAAARQSIPTPESALGFEAGADFRLARYEESIDYFRALEAASDHVRLIEVGETSMGRPWTLAVISSPANLANLDRLRAIAQRLAHPAGLTDTEARSLAAEGRTFVDISGGLHASEVAGAQHTIQLAYDLVANADKPKNRAILDNVVLLLWPSLNPDGQDIVVDWYRQNVGGPYESAPLHELYQKYIGHDNNRDAYMLNVTESRVITRAWRDWEPQIIHVHHQSSPFPTRIWLPPFAEPVAPRAPALMAREVNAIGMLMAQALESNGQPGATHMGTGFDAWYPGYIDYLPMMQNIVAYWTETALYRYATPYFYTMGDFPQNMRDLRPGSLYSSPWTGGWWRLRDAVEYMLTASIAVLDYAAKYREDVLYNRYQAGRDAIARYTAEPPYAYIVPQSQGDPMAAVELLRRLAFNGIRVSRLSRDAVHNGQTWPAGTWVVPMDQEFAELARQLLDVQVYPDLREYPDGPPEQPYDAAGWTLQYMMGVHLVTVVTPLEAGFREAMEPVGATTGPAIATDPASGNGSMAAGAIRATAAELTVDAFLARAAAAPDAPFAAHAVAGAIQPPAGTITGSGSRIAIDPAQNNGFSVLQRAIAAGGTVRYAGAGAGAGGGGSEHGRGSGRYVVDGVDLSRMREWVDELGVRAERTNAAGDAAVATRVALYKPWRASMDEGWTRWLFDTYGIRYTTITNADFAAGGLGDRFDVIIFASDGAGTVLNGFAPGTVPGRFAGGIGDGGIRELDAFVRVGGTLVCLNQSTDLAIDELHLPVRNVLQGVNRRDFFANGSILQVIADTEHPVMAGMPERASIFFDRSPAFERLDGFQGTVLARYVDRGSPLLSGYLLGEEQLNGRAAALDVVHGDGRVVLIGFRPQWRGQPFGSFRVLFNAALYGRAVAGTVEPAGSAGG